MQVRRWLAVVVTGAAIAATAVGCAEEDADPSGGQSPTQVSTSPSATDTQPVEPTEPTPPAAMERNDAEGAKAFAEYYWQVVNYAQATGDTARLGAMERDTCRGCTAPREWIDEVYTSGGRIRGGLFRVTSLAATPLRVSGEKEAVGFSVRMELSATSGSVLSSSGEITERSRATDLTVVLLTSPGSQGSWLVDEWQVER